MTSETSTETGHGPPYLKEDGHGPPRLQPIRSFASDNGEELTLGHKFALADVEGGKRSVSSSGAVELFKWNLEVENKSSRTVGETPLEVDLLTAMTGKNEEILRLRQHMQLLQGKIKGYQTLGMMLTL